MRQGIQIASVPEWRPNPAAPLWSDRIQTACFARKRRHAARAGPVIRRKRMKHHSSELGLASFAPSTVTVRSLDVRDRAAARRGGMPLSWAAATPPSSTVQGGSEIIESVFRHRTHFLYAEEAGRIVGVLPLAHVDSWLFGAALVSLPFAVYGGVAADAPEAATALEDEAQALGQPARRAASRASQRRRAASRTGRRRTSTSPSARKSCPDVEANMLAIPRKQRAMVRKGSKNGLTSEIDAHRRSLLRAVRGQRPPARHAGAAAGATSRR